MKHLYHIISLIVLSLLLSIETIALTQTINTQNADGWIEKEILLKAFESHIDTLPQLPQAESECIRWCKDYLFNLDLYDDNIEAFKIIDNSPEAANMTPKDISKQCIEKDMLDIIEKKRQDTENQQLEKQLKKDASSKSTKPRRILLKIFSYAFFNFLSATL